jgi:hypothetical protein
VRALARPGALAALLALWLSGCSQPGRLAAEAAAVPSAAPNAAAPPVAGRPEGPLPFPTLPKLVVLVVVDGLPMRQVLQYRDQLAPDGFARFLNQGAWYSQAHYRHAHTVTAPGHATMLTGAYPERTGIISNEWRDRRTQQPVYNTMDPACRYLEHPTAPLDGTSARQLKAPTVGDVLIEAQPGAKVIAVSGKDRGAILPAGHRGIPYMYMASSGGFSTSSCVMSELPAWVKAFNARKPADAYFNATWQLLLPASAYERSVADGQSWQSASSPAHRLPAAMRGEQPEPNARFRASLMTSPFGDELTLAFAREALQQEGLGADAVPDVLSVSLSSHDYVNHAFGPESRQSHDHLLHLDRHLERFFRFLDEAVGQGQYALVLTSDHGFADTPEWARSQGRDAGRIAPARLLQAINQRLSARWGEGAWATQLSANGVLLDEARITRLGLPMADVQREAAQALKGVEGVLQAFTEADMRPAPQTPPAQASPDPLRDAVRRSWHPEVSPPVLYVTRPGWFVSSSATGSTHGTPHPDDSHVPILAYGHDWFGQGEVKEAVEVVDIAPTLARLLRLPPPSGSGGRPLPLPRRLGLLMR